jgi:hypothetical protein
LEDSVLQVHDGLIRIFLRLTGKVRRKRHDFAHGLSPRNLDRRLERQKRSAIVLYCNNAIRRGRYDLTKVLDRDLPQLQRPDLQIRDTGWNDDIESVPLLSEHFRSFGNRKVLERDVDPPFSDGAVLIGLGRLLTEKRGRQCCSQNDCGEEPEDGLHGSEMIVSPETRRSPQNPAMIREDFASERVTASDLLFRLKAARRTYARAFGRRVFFALRSR